MKHIFYLLFSSFFCTCLYGQNVKYVVSEVSRGVTVQNNTSSDFKELKPTMLIKPENVVNFKSGGRIVFINDNTGAYYEHESKDSEQIKVATIIKHQSKGFIGSLLSTLFPSDSEHGVFINQRGGITRGEEEIPIAQRLFSDWDPQQKKVRAKINSNLKLILHKMGSKSFCPEIINNTGDTLYVNILCLNRKNNTRDIVFSYTDENGELLLKLVPSDSAFLKGLLLEKSKEKTYIVFGTSEHYSSIALKNELQTGIYSSNSIDNILLYYGISEETHK